MEVEFDEKGTPLVSFSKSAKVVMVTTEDSVPTVTTNKDVELVEAGKYKVVPWYDDNDFPQQADKTISETPVLKRAIGDLTKVTLGQGVFPCEIEEVMADGREKLKVINDPDITKQLQGYVVRRYLAKTAYDINAFGNSFVQFIPNIEGTKIIRPIPVNALHCRLEGPANDGTNQNVIVSGKWPDADAKSITSYILLDETDPFAHLLRLKEENKLKGTSVFMHVKSSFSSNDFYPLPNWFTAKRWIPISQKVPQLIDAGLDNFLNITFLIKIPWSYWERKYPEDEFETTKERRAKIETDIQKMEEKFTTVENARKALITHFGDDEGANEDKWEIEILQPKFSQENFINSNAADTQIAIAAGYSPDLLGLMYGNSKGGSMQRELLLLQYALSWEARQQIRVLVPGHN